MTISGNGTLRKKMATKAAAAISQSTLPLSARLAIAQQRLDHDRQHRRLDADEQRLGDRQLAEGRVQHRQREHHQRARQHEQQPGRQAALEPVQAPADVGGELHGLGPRQQHAEVERR